MCSNDDIIKSLPSRDIFLISPALSKSILCSLFLNNNYNPTAWSPNKHSIWEPHKSAMQQNIFVSQDHLEQRELSVKFQSCFINSPDPRYYWYTCSDVQTVKTHKHQKYLLISTKCNFFVINSPSSCLWTSHQTMMFWCLLRRDIEEDRRRDN